MSGQQGDSKQIEKLRADVNLPPQLIHLIENINKALESLPADSVAESTKALLELVRAATAYFERSAAE